MDVAARYRDGRTRQVHVSTTTPAGVVRCGRIEFNTRERLSRFIYEDDYRGHPLDPVNLPVNTGRRVFEVDPVHNSELLHRVFLDYMPGAWGLNVLVAEFPCLKEMLAVEKLHWLGSRTVGSLSFHVDAIDGEQPVNGAARLEQVRQRSVGLAMGRLSRLGSLDKEAGSGAAPRWIVQGLSAFGGVRPKCTYRDRSGGQWIAKFNLEGDPYNCARVEHAVALLAAQAGIDIVKTRYIRVRDANDILLVRRFDRGAGRCFHKVSVYSLCPEAEVKSHSGGDYALIFKAIERCCVAAQRAKAQMVRRMLFNIRVNNTDDHLKNFELIFNDAHGGFDLSPAFDITIDPYRSPRATGVFDIAEPRLHDEHLAVMSRRCMVPLSVFRQARHDIEHALANWRQTFKEAGVRERDLRRVARVLDVVG